MDTGHVPNARRRMNEKPGLPNGGKRPNQSRSVKNWSLISGL
ncbi:hypothetical protein [Mucilaginibacter achroorhodeus]|nr:hypothetical protein [Mucilaginibacter achroorhodeus]